MPVDNRKTPSSKPPQTQAKAQPQGRPRAGGQKAGETASDPRGASKKRVSFSALDAVATYVPGEGLAGHDLPKPQAAKPPAPVRVRHGARPACAHLNERDGTQSVLWPSGQRYSGATDAHGMPHGDGTVRLADGHDHVSQWFHGTCVAVAGDVNRAKSVEAYVGPAASRAARGAGAAEKPSAAQDASSLLGRLRRLSKKGKL